MLNRIVVGYDGSEESEDALAFAGALASAADARLAVTRIFEFGPLWAVGAGGLAPGPTEVVREYEQDTLGRLESVAERIGAEDQWAVSDSAAHGLHAIAERGEADLIVVGSSHLGPSGQIFPGSVGFRLLHGSPCPVAVAPRGMRERPESTPSRIAVGYDGRDEARLALREAFDLARQVGAAVRVITAAEPPPVVYGHGGGISGGYAVLAEGIEGMMQAKLDEALTEAPDDLAVEGELLRGDPVEALLEGSADADLLVIGSRGYGPVRGVLLGSVSMDVLRSAACPVIVLPRGAGKRAADGPRDELASTEASR